MVGFQKRLAALPAFGRGFESVEQQRAVQAASRKHVEEVHVDRSRSHAGFRGAPRDRQERVGRGRRSRSPMTAGTAAHAIP